MFRRKDRNSDYSSPASSSTSKTSKTAVGFNNYFSYPGLWNDSLFHLRKISCKRVTAASLTMEL